MLSMLYEPWLAVLGVPVKNTFDIPFARLHFADLPDFR